MLTKTNYSGYEKDVDTNLVINKNRDEYTLYIQNRERAKEFRKMAQNIEKLNKEVFELRQMVQDLMICKNGKE
jgi:predicted DNA binding CopG/RHH family protein